jgi:hypothetical protein
MISVALGALLIASDPGGTLALDSEGFGFPGVSYARREHVERTGRGVESIIYPNPPVQSGVGPLDDSRAVTDATEAIGITLTATAAEVCREPGEWTRCSAVMTAIGMAAETEGRKEANRLRGRILELEIKLRDAEANLMDAEQPVVLATDSNSEFWLGVGIGSAAVAALLGGIAIIAF